MAGTRRGARRGARKSVPHTTLDDDCSIPTRFGTVLSSPLRSPVRCVTTSTPVIERHSSPMPITNSNVADENSIPNPLIEMHSSPMPITNSNNVADENSSANYQSPTSSAAHNNNSNLAIIHNSEHSSSTKFSPTNSRCFRTSGSINITEFAQKLREDMEIDPEEEEVDSAPEPGFLYVDQHQVKTEFAPLVRDIFDKHGDITEGSHIKTPATLSFLLQQLCGIYHKLNETKFFDISIVELKKMLDQVVELEGLKVNVGWLRERIHNLIKLKTDFIKYTDYKKMEEKQKVGFESFKNEASLLQYQLCVVQEKMEAVKLENDETKKVIADIRERVVDYTTHSLVHGLL